ncbi:unnamed protein product [Sphagnum jensenii]|jgi:hypothetical protein
MKTEAMSLEHQESRNHSANIQASPQAARKKRFTKINFTLLTSPRASNDAPISPDQVKEEDSQEWPARGDIREPGSFGPKAARNHLTYV